MRTYISIGIISTFIAGAAFAQSFILDRQSHFKTIAQTTQALRAMADGSVEFNAELAKTGLMQVEASVNALPELFPEGSLDIQSEASPEIWENRAEFDALLQQFIDDAKVDIPPQNSTELTQKLRTISSGCKACHDRFRIESF